MSKPKTAILDYDLGNVRSISNALKKVGAECVLTRESAEIHSADALVIPGVGAFRHGMQSLEKYGLVKEIHKYAESGKPVLGICLGMQMLLDRSEEFGETKGLGLIPGSVRKLRLTVTNEFRIPHVQWNRIYPKTGTWENTIFESVETDSKFYFVHSYAAEPEKDENILSLTKYGDCEFVSAVRNANVYGCQFHPEKSAAKGLEVLSDFIKLCKI